MNKTITLLLAALFTTTASAWVWIDTNDTVTLCDDTTYNRKPKQVPKGQRVPLKNNAAIAEAWQNQINECITPPDPITCPDGQHLNSAGDGCDDDAIVEPPMHGDMPVVDTSKEITPAIGSSIRDIVAAQEPSSPAQEKGGAVRFFCDVSHMSNNDPIVYPNQEGASHHHTFFGNTSVNHASDVKNMANTGNSTCAGGTANRSAYWVPSMIDTATNTPLKPVKIGLYYKTGDPDKVIHLPKGLRMIARPHTASFDNSTRFQCNNGDSDLNYKQDKIVQCQVGQFMKYALDFPRCWDGVNLDSPNHTDHVSYGYYGECPSSHPKVLPTITFSVFYKVTKATGTSTWRLASDKASEDAGYSVHGDWVNGWDEKVAKTFVDRCLKASRDCHGDLLGDGTALKSIDD